MAFKDEMARHRIRATELLRRSARLERRARTPAFEDWGRPSGRALTPAQLCSAWEGRPLPRRVRAKLVRAVNAVLSQRGARPLSAEALFSPEETT